jgi:hypothetical protein
MNQNFNLNIPKSLRGIKLKDWVKFIDVYNKNKDNESNDFLNKKMLEIFCDVDLKSLLKIPVSSFDTIIAHLYDTLNSQTPLVNTFKMVGSDGVEVEFGLIPNLDKMSYGEWEDLENYIWDNKSLHRAMAVLYRPLIWQIGGKYRIHEYQGTDFYADLMKEMPIDVALGARVFFYRLVKKLGDYTMDSILSQYQTEKENSSEVVSEENGKVIQQYLNLRKEMSEELTKLQHSPFINA